MAKGTKGTVMSKQASNSISWCLIVILSLIITGEMVLASSTARAEPSAIIQSELTLVGTFMWKYWDSFSSSPPRSGVRYYLEQVSDRSSSVPLDLSGASPEQVRQWNLLRYSRVAVTGVRQSGTPRQTSLRVTSIQKLVSDLATPLPAPQVTGNQRWLNILCHFPNDPAPNPAFTTDYVQQIMNHLELTRFDGHRRVGGQDLPGGCSDGSDQATV